MVAVSLKKKSSRRRHKGRAEDGIRDVERSRCFFFQAEDGIRDVERSRGLGDVYKRQQSRYAAQPGTQMSAGMTWGGERTRNRCSIRMLSLIHI